MKSKLLLTAFLAIGVAASALTAGVHAQTANSGKRTDAERKQYLEAQKSKIDQQAERQADKARDGQKGMGNSGATQKRVDQIEKERDARKKALDDHYKKGAR